MLRHSGITDALAAGAPLFSVQKVAGHTQVTTTQGYAHVDMDAQQKAMSALDIASVLGTTYLLPPDDKPAESLPPD
jgi:integrase/recombinase XerC